MTGELKRTLWDDLLQIVHDFDASDNELDEQFLRDLLGRLAAGSPEVIEAMLPWMGGTRHDSRRANARAALAAGMKKVAES